MRVVSAEFLAKTDSFIDLLLVLIAILVVTVIGLTACALTAIGKNEKLEEEIKYLERRNDRLIHQNKTIYK